jgi:hypothetical protein
MVGQGKAVLDKEGQGKGECTEKKVREEGGWE